MSKRNDLPSFPANLDDIKGNSNDYENNDWNQEDDNELKVALNGSFLESLDDLTKFSYAGVCAATLHLLYDSDNSTYCHEFVTSFVAHLCLPSNVANTMQAIADGHAEKTTDVFLKTLKQNQHLQEDPLLMVNDLVMWAITATNGSYDARTRYTIRHISWKLQIKYEDVEGVEELLIQMLRSNSEKEKEEQEATRLKKAKRQKWKRYALIGLATAGGGALVGLTGGLAAPLVAAGAGAILGGASAAALGSVAGLAVITSLFGAAGAGLTGYKMKRRVGGIDEFMFKPLTVSAQPNITIVISGWLSNDDNSEFVYPWRHLMHSKEQYTLVWESKHLKRLGNAFEYILNGLMSMAATEALKYTVLAGLITAITWPATLISAAGVIDNPWSVCVQRAAQVGRQLAEVLLAREHGCRPVTLIGYSLGARVIFHCLEEMSKRKNHQGIIEDVYLLGAPVSGDPKDWAKFKPVIAGHITNAYSRTDWLLKFLYRTSSIQVKVAGLQPVMWKDRRMINIDLSSVIDGHLDYAKHMDTVLSAVGIRTKEDVLKKLKQKSDIADNESTTDHVSATTSHDKIIEPPTLGGVPINDSTVDSQSHLQIEDDAPCAEPAIQHNAEVDDKPCIEAETVREKDSVCAESTASQSAEVDGKPCVKPETDREKFGEKKWVGNKQAVETLLDGVTLVSGDCDGFEVVDKIA